MKTIKKRIKLLSLVLALFTVVRGASSLAQSPTIPIVVAPSASEGERLAAQDLLAALQRIYPGKQFVLGDRLPEAGRCILVGNAQSDLEVKNRVSNAKLNGPESFVITEASEGPRQLGVIAGADARGTAYGVYALLEKLGCGFFLSYDAWPTPRTNDFSFEGWNLADRPLVKDRVVFDWHNFLSGCSTWNFEDWQLWTAQSRKMGYNAIMVHAYGNNPMVSFNFNGKTKPVGYLSTTVRGRDWSTMHVNDVCRLWGGEVFNQPVFGAEAAICPEDERAASAQRLMQQVFADAAKRDMGVYLAVDMDTGTANPQELVMTLPEDARFAVEARAGGSSGLTGQGSQALWLPNPDTPEGYGYYKAQVEAILKTYPQVTCLIPWFRAGGTPWLEIKESEMPPRWREEYQAEIAKTPEAAKLWHAPQVFALSKIIRAFDRALKELGHDRVQLASGTWRFDFLPPCDRFFPLHVKLIGLDYEVLHDRPQLGDAESRKVIRDAGAHRAVVPVIWAQHDDGNYIGRSYTPFADFASKLADANASGFGIIHWTTRPLDLFFKSHAQQVWQNARDLPLRASCDDMAEKSFGASARSRLGEYLERWVTDAPKFGRDTTDWFIDKPLTNVNEVVAGCRERLTLIEAVDQTPLTPEQRDRLNYFKGLEEFIIAFYQNQELFQRSQATLKEGRLAEARGLIQQCRPESDIEQFARFSSLGGITRGEQGLVVTMNLHWLTHILRHRQALGLDPVCFSFGPTMHEPLAQNAGKFTFDVTTNHLFWERWGEKEAGAATWTLPAGAKLALDKSDPGSWADIGRRGIAFDKPLKLRLQPIMGEDSRGRSKPAKLPVGEYLCRLLFADAEPVAGGRRVCDVELGTGLAFRGYEFDPVPAKFLRVVCVGNSRNSWNSLVEVKLEAMAVSGGTPAVSASSNSSVRYPARNVLDGDPDTRWAARGTNEWLQFELVPGAIAQCIGLAWYQPDSRRARFKVQVSNDGVQWNPVKNLQRSADSGGVRSRIEFGPSAGGNPTVIERSFRVQVGTTGCVDLLLTPTEGRLNLSGVVVEPLFNPGQAESKNFSAPAIAAANRRPNLIFVQPDSWDGRVLGVLGHPAMKRATPNIDRLANRGTVFRNAYCPNPICCPSRAAMWSGLHTWHCEAWNNYKGLESEVPTAFSRLRDHGYLLATPAGGIGKMDHLSGAHSLMNRLGAWTGPANIELPILTMAAPKVNDDDDPRCHKKDWTLIDRAKEFLNAQSGAAAPFFLYVGLAAPHPPFTSNRRYLELIDRDAVTLPPEDREDHPVMRYQRLTKNWEHGFDRESVLRTRSIYYAMCAEADAMVGALLDEVDRLGLTENTYFIFSSDHGENNMEHRQWYKMNFYESSARVPLVVAGPGVVRGRILDNIVQLVDLHPTLMDMAGVPVPAGLDGESLLPLLKGTTQQSRDSAVAMFSDLTANTTMFMLRRGDWKYVAYPGYPPQLFNLKDDPNEADNLAQRLPDMAAALDAELRKIVDYDAVHHRVITYDKVSFRNWREQAKAGDAKGEAKKGKAAPRLTYDQGMTQCYKGWSPELDEKIERWLLKGDDTAQP